MRILLLTLTIISFLFFSCKKKETTTPPTIPPAYSDSFFEVISVSQKDTNEFAISYRAIPGTNENFTNLYFFWSTTPDFSQETNSVPAPITPNQPNTISLAGLKYSTKYYSRLSATYKGKQIFSNVWEWTTGNFKLLNIRDLSLSYLINKGDSFIPVKTNLGSIMPNIVTDTKIFIGPYECPLARDEGTYIFFHVPENIPTGKHILKILRYGVFAEFKDPIEISRGIWKNLVPPDLPLNFAARDKGLFSFGTTQSAQKGYIVGGVFFNGALPGPDGMYSGDIIEYDPISKGWTKKTPTKKRYFTNPWTYYYNNSIYVIGGREGVWDVFNSNRDIIIKKMLRLDLGSMNWIEMDVMPIYGNYNMTSFELNNEWYIGMGTDSSNISISTGEPIPSKKFWKYNPSTNQWVRLADFPGGEQRFPTCFTVGSKAYAYYGAIPYDERDPTAFFQELWEYNPSSNAWTRITLPSNGGPLKGDKYQIISYNGKAYFLTSQKMSVGCCFYYVALQNTCIEWDPVTNIYTRVAYPQKGEVFKLIYSKDGQFTFHSDALGAYERLPNKTMLFDLNK